MGAENVVGNASLEELLHFALECNDVDWVMLLLHRGADPSATNAESDTALHVCLRKAKRLMAECVREMVRCGADVNLLNDYDETPLHLALDYRWSKDIVELFISRGPSIPPRNCVSSATLGKVLHNAVKTNDVQRVMLLLDCGADPNATNAESDTPLHVCLRKGEQEMAECVRELVRRGADVSHHNNHDKSPVHLALDYWWSRDFIKLFILEGHGMDFDRQVPATSIVDWSPLERVVLEDKSMNVSLNTPDESLAILFLRMGASRRDLEICLWNELNGEKRGGPLLETLMDSFAYLPSLSQLQHNILPCLFSYKASLDALGHIRDLDKQLEIRVMLLRLTEPWYSEVEGLQCPTSQRAVQRDNETIEQKKADYCQRRREVPTLLHLSRCSVRHAMKANVRQVISLPIPIRVQKQILLGYQQKDSEKERVPLA